MCVRYGDLDVRQPDAPCGPDAGAMGHLSGAGWRAGRDSTTVYAPPGATIAGRLDQGGEGGCCGACTGRLGGRRAGRTVETGEGGGKAAVEQG